jgi:Glycosyl hydrolase family 26
VGLRRVVVLALLLGALAGGAGTASGATAGGPYLGTYGAGTLFPAASHPIKHVIVGWGQGVEWGSPFSSLLRSLGPIPMLGLNGRTTGGGEITAAQVARGAGDAYLAALNQAISEYGSLVYVRPWPEMDGSWNVYCAFNANGSPRSAAHSTANFRKAFARMYLVLHGGTKQALDAKLQRLGLPGVNGGLPVVPRSRLRIVWNPLGWANPPVVGNAPEQYYPGDAYVDVVGGDVYKTPTNVGHMTALEALSKAHPNKPFSIPEWGLQGVDDPDFVTRLAEFVRMHRRTEAVVLFSRPGPYDLRTKPRSLAAYRSQLVPLGRTA